jgi:hypothetical protein
MGEMVEGIPGFTGETFGGVWRSGETGSWSRSWPEAVPVRERLKKVLTHGSRMSGEEERGG